STPPRGRGGRGGSNSHTTPRACRGLHPLAPPPAIWPSRRLSCRQSSGHPERSGDIRPLPTKVRLHRSGNMVIHGSAADCATLKQISQPELLGHREGGVHLGLGCGYQAAVQRGSRPLECPVTTKSVGFVPLHLGVDESRRPLLGVTGQVAQVFILRLLFDFFR